MGLKNTYQELIDQLQNFYRENGEITRRMFEEHEEYVSGSTIAKRFGSWNKALKEADIPVNNEYSRIELTEDMKKPSSSKAYLVGALFCDLSLSQNATGRVYLETSVTDKEFAEEIRDQIKLWTGTDYVSLEKQNCEDNRKDVYRVRKGVKPAKDELSKFMEMKVNDVIDEFQSYLSDLVRGMWDGDGSIPKRNEQVRFYNSQEKIRRLYMKCLHEIIGIELDLNDPEQVGKTTNYGEFSVGSERGFGESRCVRIPHKYRKDFQKTIQPTIKRKVKVFESV